MKNLCQWNYRKCQHLHYLQIQQQKKLSRASDLCQKGLEIRDATLGKLNPFSLKSLELLADIQDAFKPHSKSARETRMEFKSRLPQLAAAYEQAGDPLLSQALLISSQFATHKAQEVISGALTILCQDRLRKRKS